MQNELNKTLFKFTAFWNKLMLISQELCTVIHVSVHVLVRHCKHYGNNAVSPCQSVLVQHYKNYGNHGSEKFNKDSTIACC